MKKNIKYFIYKNLFAPCTKNRVLLIDDEFFVTDSIKIEHASLSNKSLDHLVKLRIETICPFKLEDILYGYVWRKQDRRLVIFIAYKASIAEHYCDFLQSNYVFPVFFCNLLYNISEKIEKAEVVNDHVVFSMPEKTFRLHTTDIAIYRANLISPDKKLRQLRQNLIGQFCERGVYACLFCLFMLFCSCGVVAKKHCQLNQFNKNLNYDVVNEIKSKSFLINKLQKFLKDENFCLYALDRVNNVRPEGVVFSNICAHANSRTLNISGHGNAVGEVINYQRALNQIPEVKKATTSRVRAKDGESFFDLEVQFE